MIQNPRIGGLLAGLFFAVSAGLPVAAFADTAQEQRAEKTAQIPRCASKLGTIAIVEPERHWWTEHGLGSPEALLKVYVNRSGCFSLVDRGKGLSAAQVERGLAASGDLRMGSNIGKGQIKAADYVLVPDLVSQNRDAGGNALGGLIGGMIGGTAGAIIGGIDFKSKTADVVLTVTDVRSTEQLAMIEGHADKTDIGWGVGGGLFAGGFGAAGATGYDNTEIGQVIALAYLEAYTKLVDQFGAEFVDGASNRVGQAVRMTRAGKMYTQPSTRSEVVRPLDTGMLLYPTGNKDGLMWEVQDEMGNKGWVSSIQFELAK
ncbi:MAG: CsgG/HfaB family protein [Chromatiales bacterium]|jgi:hypothetical protein|nr:CsgG/HfaB family protein [Chromatiales bacterium]MDX9767088.1 CsgG/HfaB family protein [Ectothiorhodospiraceae bacterium]